MSWFDSQPLGRIINRFSRDLDLIDTQLPDSLRVFGTTSSMTIAVLLVIAVVFPIFLLPLLPVMAVFYFLQRYYRKTSVDLKRLENVSRSPLFAHFSETMTGAGQATIRAYQVQQSFIKRNLDLLDDNNRAYYLTMIALRWISLRMELIASLLTLAVAMFGLHFRTVDPGLVALSITYSLQVAAVFTWYDGLSLRRGFCGTHFLHLEIHPRTFSKRCIKQGTEFEQNMSSVERLLHYCSSLPSEVASECKDAPGADDAMLLDKVIVAPTAAWPERGTISIKNLVLRYRDDLPDVLHGVSFDVGFVCAGRRWCSPSAGIMPPFLAYRYMTRKKLALLAGLVGGVGKCMDVWPF